MPVILAGAAAGPFRGEFGGGRLADVMALAVGVLVVAIAELPASVLIRPARLPTAVQM